MSSEVVPGAINDHAGALWRKTSVLKRWKREKVMILMPFTAVEGVFQIFVLFKDEHIEDAHITTQFQQCEVRPNDPRKTKNPKDIFGFEIRFGGGSVGEQAKWIPFRCDSLQELRRWMISFGYTGPGTFSNGDPRTRPLGSWPGIWDVTHPSMDAAQQAYVSSEQRNQDQRNTGEPPSYDDVMTSTFSIRFSMERHQREHCGAHPQPPPLPPLQQSRREVDDTMLPPNGPPVSWLVSSGFGAEIGLPDDVQQLWDPYSGRFMFLDHNTHSVSWIDPRPPKPSPPTIVTKMHPVGDNKRWLPKASTGMTNLERLDRVAKSALSKPHALVVRAEGTRGIDGAPGVQGEAGEDGCEGMSGIFDGAKGRPGEDGDDGGPGTDGENGTKGTHASDIQVFVRGDCNKVQITGSVEDEADLGGLECEHVVFLNARGGDGGHGGPGGKGGEGGDGGHGGSGASGKDGHNSYTAGVSGGPGGPGGDGGNGGDGGDGGQGGNGGHAGDSGMGGNVQVSVYDPRLLMLVEVDASPGTQGTGGRRGDGGEGGLGGLGGMGGFGGSGGSGGPSSQQGDFYTPAGGTGMSGMNGMRGMDGTEGDDGPDGVDGRDGRRAVPGSILWSVLDPKTDSVLCQTGERYEILTTSYKVTSEINDGIFEPNEKIIVEGIVVKNIGGMYCPDGAEVTFRSTTTVNFVPGVFVLPKIDPDKDVHVPEVYTGRIFDVPSPITPGAYHGKAEVLSRVHMFNRPFDNGFRKVVLDVQYPIQLDSLQAPTQMGKGEENLVSVMIKNISTMSYGDGVDSGGFVEVRFRLDRRLLPVPREEFLQTPQYMLTFDPAQRDSVSARVYHIAPNSNLTIVLPICMEGGAELFDRCLVQAEIFLRGKLIEYNQHLIRVCPNFIQRDVPGDVLMVTGPEITRPLFILWQSIFEMLDVTLDFWDVERYNGLSVDLATNTRHQVSWVNRYGGRMILYPYHNPSLLLGEDIITHFYMDGNPNNDLQSSLLLMANTEPLIYPQIYLGIMNEKLTRSQPQLNVGHKFSGKHLCYPTTCACFCCYDPAHRKAKKICKNLEKRNPRNAYLIYGKNVNYNRIGGLTWSYGLLDVRANPLQRSACLYMTCDPYLLQLGLDDQQHTPEATEIPLGSNFGQVLLMVILNLPIHARTKALARGQASAQMPTFTTIFGKQYTLTTLVAMSLEEYLCTEVMARPERPDRLTLLAEEVQNNGATYAATDVGPHLHLAISSFLKAAKLCPSHYKKRAADLFREVQRSLKPHGEKRVLDKFHTDAQAMLKDKLRVSFRMLVRQDYLIQGQRLKVKDKEYDLTRKQEDSDIHGIENIMSMNQ